MNLQNNIIQTAKNVLRLEAEAIAKVADLIDERFKNCVEAILQIKGRVVVTGIGKSANIATKIVATLNSTGTPALFMHAADAIHGDLGMIQPEDFVICISKSGNTPEIKVLVPLLKRKGAKLAAMVCTPDSYLGQNSDFILNAYVEREACPHNLAPTTSTTVALALGDALAVSLLEARGFSSEDFAVLHPGGALGKRLYLKVDDIYGKNQAPVVTETASLKEIIIEISSKMLGATAVVQNNTKIITGVITDGDLRRMLNNFDSIADIQAKDIMTASPITIEADQYAAEAMAIMQNKSITQLIVTKSGNFEGFIHLHDLLREGIV
ncbi:KpsF/GutQ family sugar-phosphate isomerase [Pontibacter harenae]|uniref:KpsF/GutQ family sugar-phosphate isomerase n=1 Tax=Pontibacter harenae TaxID=2894083 RepID=UPI001E38A78B|nr:KpsF/GutQ family sugar-phosphate isomerase [Pontibacter harenae]MCC9168481.1 KpsF/GutQ family sugar-phosphate isomerase [Pontibacter harenae]